MGKALTLRLGGVLSGQILTLDEQFLRYKGPYGSAFSVPRGQIETVVVDTRGRGKGTLKVIGRGTDLASVSLPLPWCNQAQRWLLEQLQPPAG